MPDGYTDAQLSDGTTLRFIGSLGPDEVRQKVQTFRAGRSISANPPGMPTAPNAIQRQELQNPRSVNFAGDLPGTTEGRGLREAIRGYGTESIGEIGGGAADIYRGNIARGANRMLSGAETAALPVAPFAAVAAPAAMARGLVGSYLGSKVAGTGAEVLEATPEQQALASNIGGLVGGGVAASSYGPRIARAGVSAAGGALERIPIAGPMGRGALRAAVRSWRGSARVEPVYPGAPYPEPPPPVYPGAPQPQSPGPAALRANRGVFPGAPEPTATPEQLNPAIVSPARSMPGQIGAERIFGPRPTPAAPIPARPGLALPGAVEGPQTVAPPPTAPGPPESSYPPESPTAFEPQPPAPLPQAPRGFQAMREDQSLAEQIRDQAYQEDRARLRQKLQEESPVTPKTSLIEQVRGEQPPPVKLTTTKQPRARLKDAMKAPEGTTVPQTADDMTAALQRSLEQAQSSKGNAPTAKAARAGRTRATLSEQVRAGAPAPTAPSGAETTVRVPGEARRYKASYAVRELDDVQPSHSGISFAPNEKYKLVNDRDYSNPANQGKVVMNSAPGAFDPAYHVTDNPDATNGPIVTDSSGHALGGNGRAMILQRVYKYNPEGADAYKQMLMQKAGQFGVDPNQVAGMKQPVLVRQIADSEFDSPAAKQDAVTEFNKTGTAAMTPAERAIADARRVSSDTLDRLAGHLENAGPDATMADALRGRTGVDVLDELIKDGVISPQERAGLVSGDQITDAGKIRISKLMTGRFFDDPGQFDSAPASLRNKLEKLAAPLTRLEGKQGWDLMPAARDAVKLLEDARAHNVSIDDLLGQQNMFGGQGGYSEQAIALARHLKDTSAREIGTLVKKYAADAADSERSLLGPGVPPEQAFDEAFGAPKQRLKDKVKASAATLF